MEPSLVLRPVRIEDESEALQGHEAMLADAFSFLLARDDSDQPWSRYVRALDDHRCGRGVAKGWVPSTFLLATVEGRIVGRTSIRHRLNDYLSHIGGHIGYGVLPQFRRLGYATEILRQSVVIARSVGVTDILVTCDDSNVASARTIEACGGLLESTVLDGNDGVRKRRYWIR